MRSTRGSTSPPTGACAAATRAVVGAYHSHPHGPAWPSASDLAEAYYAEFIWVIVSLAAPDAEALKAFRLDGARIVELEIDPAS